MFTIQQAARLVGVPQATLRTWERRYGVVAPHRTDSGYRVYDQDSIAVLSTMRSLVDQGWSPRNAAAALLSGARAVQSAPPTGRGEAQVAAEHTEELLAAAAAIDVRRIEASLDAGMSTGSFEHAVDAWLMPALVALGEGWARGDIDVAGEHATSHQVLRRLSAAFEAAGARSRGPKVVVGLPAESRHELGALAFAVASRRLGLDVLYLGAAVPEGSWLAAVSAHRADAVVLGVVTAADRPGARSAARALRAEHPGLLVAAGGAAAGSLAAGVHDLPPRISEAARRLDDLLHPEG